MRIDGQCHCGFIRFEAEAEAGNAGICHCTDCQALSGSAFRVTVRANSGTFKLLAGEPAIYIKKTADSGTPREHAFCPRCGTPIYATSVGPPPKNYSLRLGTLRQREEFVPAHQIWTKSRLPWVEDLAAIPSATGQ